MEPEGTPQDSLDVHLRWPGSGPGPTVANDVRRGERDARAVGADDGEVDEDGGALSSGPDFRHLPEPVFVTSADPGHAAFASIAIRLDALSSATTMLRTVVNDRLSDYSERVERAQSAGGREFEDQRRLQERAWSDIRTALSASEEALSVLKRASAGLLDRLAEFDANQESRLDKVSEHIEQLDKTVNSLVTKPAVDVTPVIEGLATLQAQLGPAFRAATEPDRAAFAALLDKVSVIDTNQEARMDRVSKHIEQLANAVFALSAKPEIDLAPIIEGLGAVPDSTDIFTAVAEELQQSLERQAAAQAEDLERMVDTIEDLGRTVAAAIVPPAPDPTPDLLAGLQRLADKIDTLPQPAPDVVAGLQHLADKIDTLPRAAPGPPPDLLAGLQDLADKVESLRRRIALRARQEPLLDEAAIDALADAIASRLAPVSPPDPDLQSPGRNRRGRRE